MGVSAVFDEGASLGEVHVAGRAVLVLRVHHVGSGRVGKSVGGCFWLFGNRVKVATASFQPSISDSEGSLTWRIRIDMELLVSKPCIVSFIALIWKR